MIEVNFDGHYTERWRRVKEYLPQTEDPWTLIKNETLSTMKALMEKFTNQEFRDQIKANGYERNSDREDYRNGYRRRDLRTNFGTVKNIRIPRGRKANYKFSIFRKYQRRHDEFDTAILWATLGGMSQERTRQMFKGLMGNEISGSTVSRILKSLDKQLKEYREFPIVLSYKYLVLDGFWIHVLEGGILTEKCVMCAMGITQAGDNDLLGFMLMDGEAELSVGTLLNDLYNRGLTEVALIIHDGSKGIQAASSYIYPYAQHQRCIFHKQMNLIQNIKNKKNKKLAIKESQKIFKATNKKQALYYAKKFKNNWSGQEPAAVNKFFKDFDKCLTYFDFPRTHHPWIKTTNHIELYFKQIRRRIKPIGCFRNKSSAQRYIFGLIKIIGQNLTNIKPYSKVHTLC